MNMIHISPWTRAQGSMAGAGTALGAGGRRSISMGRSGDGEHTAPSNAAFDASLKGEDPAWGVRDLGDARALAGQPRFRFRRARRDAREDLSVVFRRSAA